MVDSIRQRGSAMNRWGLGRLRNFVVGRYRIHFANLKGLTPVRLCRPKGTSSTLHALHALCKSRVLRLSRDRAIRLNFRSAPSAATVIVPIMIFLSSSKHPNFLIGFKASVPSAAASG